MDIQSELELVEKAKEDIHAFTEIYDYYVAKLLGYCLNRMNDREVAEDIVSEVFLQAVKKIKHYDTSKGIRFGSWLYTVTHNKLVDYFRKNKKTTRLEYHSGELTEESNVTKPLEQELRKQQIASVLQTLKPRYQKIISLRFFSELSNQEIAQTMGTNSNNVAVLLHRALQSFKKKFKKMYPKSEIYNDF
ncbi:sigma-70 family RNA polymerase sigma factor [Candidatus Dojkabacteria bacterium]|uniref:Sigma-70 family RNA polymerase sigma factor n=1 Tax=Candidatus Dojkabacteria bacterium TaxID=2099670 RepID=A0A955L8J6_9BACT|nr:sigma-70 family RNA polymerase sigma factor [Candidatus Dojkabacteria bacterium]